MPNTVTGIEPRHDEVGNYHLEVTAEDGSTFEVLIPPKMELKIRTTIQENETRRAATMSTVLGLMILDVTGCHPATNENSGETNLAIHTEQFGWWGFRIDTAMIQSLIECLQAMAGVRGTHH